MTGLYRLLLALPVFAIAALSIGCSSGSNAAGPRTIVVRGTNELRFDPSTLEVKAGETIRLELDSSGGFESHSFTIDEIDGADVFADAGIVSSVEFTPTTPGRYTFYCAYADHRERGMEGILTVVE